MPSKKELLAAVENYGDTTGNYAGLTPIALKDLQRLGRFRGITISQVRRSPKLYDAVVNAFWDNLDSFGLPDDPITRALWWRAPGLYRRTEGDVESIEDPRLRNIMQNRIRNLSELYRKNTYTEALANGRYTD